MTLSQFVAMHRALQPKDDLRLGQRFSNTYGIEIPGLYYESNTDLALSMIRAFLAAHHYGDEMPMPYRPRS